MDADIERTLSYFDGSFPLADEDMHHERADFLWADLKFYETVVTCGQLGIPRCVPVRDSVDVGDFEIDVSRVVLGLSFLFESAYVERGIVISNRS